MSDKKFDEIDSNEKVSFIQEFVLLLKHNKKYWLTPIILVLLLFGILIIVGGSSAAPFIYTLFQTAIESYFYEAIVRFFRAMAFFISETSSVQLSID